MIKLPPTGIDISQGDLQAQLQHLDFCAGLLKQGFKKHEIARYFREQRNPAIDSYENGTSTYDLLSQSRSSEDGCTPLSASGQSDEQLTAPFASPIRQEEAVDLSEGVPHPHPSNVHTAVVVGKKTHAPRQSSLLRFARAVSSDPSDNGKNAALHYPPRPNITYRPRSETYSYDQSEMDDEDILQRCAIPMEKLAELSLDDDALANANSSNATVHVMSDLRPDAQPFTPSLARHNQSLDTIESPDPLSLFHSVPSSFPSSPPVVQSPERGFAIEPPRLPSVPHISHESTPRTPATAKGQSQQQFLDGSFTVYNDSVPSRFQPQTPAELSRGHFLDQFNAAYTAPPGMIRSSIAQQGMPRNRYVSDELSPTAQASMIRQRRQREFRRGLRVEGLRIDRARTDTHHTGSGPSNSADPFDIWRDDLDADGVGDENFDDITTSRMTRGMRAISGNRRTG